MKKILALVLSIMIIFSGCTSTGKAVESTNLLINKANTYKEFKDLYIRDFISLYPLDSEYFPKDTYEGLNNIEDRLYIGSEEELQMKRKFYKDALIKLSEFKDIEKNDIEYQCIKWNLETLNEGIKFENYDNQFGGINNIINRFNNLFTLGQVIEDEESARNFISRLKMVDELFINTLSSFEKGIEKGIIFDTKSIRNSINQIHRCNQLTGKHSDIYKYFVKSIEPLNIKDKDKLISEVEEILNKEYIPTLFVVTNKLEEVKMLGKDVSGTSDLPDGKEYYKHRIKTQTSLSLTPEELMKLSTKKIKELEEEIIKLSKELGYTSTNCINLSQEVFQNGKHINNADIIKEAERIMKESYENLDKIIPKEFLPESIPNIIQNTGQKYSYYSAPSFDLKKKGTFHINKNHLYNDLSLKRVVFHETVPGHHLQREYGVKKSKLHSIAMIGGNRAYSEGWAMYAQRLAYEMDFFKNPKGKLVTRLHELGIAKIIALDAGVNYYDWEEKDIYKFLSDNELVYDNYLASSIERLVANPAQSLSYLVGMWKILELRDKAEKELGDKFDLKEFNGWILENGNIPLDVLEMHIENRINEKL